MQFGLNMRVGHYDRERVFERGAVILSFDIEQIWGYFDRLNERQFRSRYPNALEAHEKLLALLCAASVSATWFIVGGLTLHESDGARDRRVAGLPIDWTSKIIVALVVRINPDAKIMSAEPLHPAFTTFVSSAAFIRWKPTAYDEKRVAGRFWTDGTQSEFRQRWSYDVTFSTPITLDPAAKTLRKN